MNRLLVRLAPGVGWQCVRRRNDLTDGLARHVRNRVAEGKGGSTCRAKHRVLQVTADVIEDDFGGRRFVVFERPLLDSAVNLPEVVDAGILLRGGARSNEVGDGDRG